MRVVPDTVYALPEPGSCCTLPTNTSMSVSKPTDCDIVNATVELSPLKLSFTVSVKAAPAGFPIYPIYSLFFILIYASSNVFTLVSNVSIFVIASCNAAVKTGTIFDWSTDCGFTSSLLATH